MFLILIAGEAISSISQFIYSNIFKISVTELKERIKLHGVWVLAEDVFGVYCIRRSMMNYKSILEIKHLKGDQV
ncbi:MAG: hypothetical protein P9M07_03300 [Candidatus Aceula meridiana]|nr:hypothetical protein [Candidatus Aceula meridiana]